VFNRPVSIAGSRRSRLAAALAVAGALIVIAPAGSVEAWGFQVHRYIADRAIDEMPAPLRGFFRKRRVQIVEHAIDPDLWRNAGFEEEPPRHFLDMDAYGAYPFDALPHDYAAAVAKFGEAKVKKEGLLPWRTADIYDRLVKAFADQKSGRGYALDNIAFFTSIIAHYVSDAHVPFHAIMNYDGQLTNQRGLHSRFETELFERYRKRVTVRPSQVTVGKAPREFIFDTLTESAKLTEPILKADRDAIGSGDVYDRAYFDRFFADSKPTLERRMSESIGAVAAIVTKAWEEGGRPDLPLDPKPRDDRRRTPAAPPQ
jgi:hypothetical protein